jgi:hypothetical protein
MRSSGVSGAVLMSQADAKLADLEQLRGRIAAARGACVAGHCVLRVPQAG